jgi:hypothetical protein
MFIQFFGNNGIKQLDSDGVDIKDPAALFIAFNQKQSVQYSIANDLYVRKLINMSFLAEVEDAAVKDILIGTSVLSVYTRSTKEPELGILILTGNLDEWFVSINAKLTEASPFRTRLLYGKIYLYFQQSCLRFMWSGYGREKLGDETFIIKKQ